MGNLGLKGAWKKYKGASLRFRIKEYYWDLRYAWQRAWRGYDNIDVFDLGFITLKKMPILLREFKKHNDALFHNLENNTDYITYVKDNDLYIVNTSTILIG